MLHNVREGVAHSEIFLASIVSGLKVQLLVSAASSYLINDFNRFLNSFMSLVVTHVCVTFIFILYHNSSINQFKMYILGCERGFTGT